MNAVSRLPDPAPEPRATTGIDGFDDILGGGFTPQRLYLLEGVPGSGKTTLALQFLLEGVRRGEPVLYVTLSETEAELRGVAASHGWSLDGITIRELVPSEDSLRPDDQYTMFHPSEVELSETTRTILAEVEQLKPARVVFDSFSELRLLAGNPLRYRRQILALKQFFSGRSCTVLMLDDLTSANHDLQVQSIAHGVVRLEQLNPEYGSERRRLIVLKFRGARFRGGYHDYVIHRGGIEVFPRLVAVEHRLAATMEKLASGIAEMDILLGGGIERGTSTLIVGAAGTGKSSLATQFVAAAAARGQRSALFIFDESTNTLLTRSAGLGMDLQPYLADGRVTVQQVDPAELSPGEFVHAIRRAVERQGVSIVMIDSLNGYLNAMPGERFLIIQLHELLTYLGHAGIATLLIGAHQGLVGGQMIAPVDASYLADTVILIRYYETRGEVHQAISVVKKRSGARADHPRLSVGGRPPQRRATAAQFPRRAHRSADRGGGGRPVARRETLVTEADRERLEQRVLVLAPTGKDAALTQSVLNRAGVACVESANLEQVCDQLNAGAAAVLLAEEAVTPDRGGCLAEWLDRQPPWSDLPVLVLTRPGADSAAVAQAMDLFGNVTVLERPTRVAALVSAVRTALRARHRQYQIRDHLAERARTEAALRDADQRKDEFLAILAHELRNPLAPIRNSLHILRLTGRLDPAAERVGEMMERQVNHLVRLVDDLLEVSRITRGKIELRKEPVEIAAIVRNAVETSRPQIEAGSHQLALALPPEPLTVEGDAVRLAQVFANLLNNSAKYTDEGGQIWLTVRREEAEVAVSVRDSGAGIPPDMLPRVFELFTQVDRQGDRAQGGLGIGLTLVKSLVEMHGGSVQAHSAGPGRGSEFVVRLPLATPRGSGPGAAATPSAVLTPCRVLVVDDNRDAAESLGMLLKLLGAEVQVVFSGPDALEALATYRPSVVLLDIGMPGMDGHEVARRIRQQRGSEEMTLIALTGWGQEEDRRRSQSAGFDYHLIKPADVNALETLLLSLESRPAKR